MELILKEIITTHNWTQFRYSNGRFYVQISFGGIPSPHDIPSVEFIYYVVQCDQDNVEISAKSFVSLGMAVDFINKNYGHWEFKEVSANEGSSCSKGSCVAH